MTETEIDHTSILRGSLTQAYQDGHNAASALTYPRPPADSQGRWLYMNGYTDGAATVPALPREKDYVDS